MINDKQINFIIEVIKEAGKIALERQNKLEIKIKDDGTKVTNADIEISEFINNNLSKAFPRFNYICEEGNKLIKDVGACSFFIDPIDGTNSYISNSENFAINIAIADKNNYPIFGFIYAPKKDGGKIIYNDDMRNVFLIRGNVKKIIDKNILSENETTNKISILTGSRSRVSDINFFFDEVLKDNYDKFSLTAIPSSVKFIELVEGKFDIIIQLSKTMYWDLSAGHAILNCLNGEVKNISIVENKIKLSNKNYKDVNFINKFFIAYKNNKLLTLL